MEKGNKISNRIPIQSCIPYGVSCLFGEFLSSIGSCQCEVDLLNRV